MFTTVGKNRKGCDALNVSFAGTRGLWKREQKVHVARSATGREDMHKGGGGALQRWKAQ